MSDSARRDAFVIYGYEVAGARRRPSPRSAKSLCRAWAVISFSYLHRLDHAIRSPSFTLGALGDRDFEDRALAAARAAPRWRRGAGAHGRSRFGGLRPTKRPEAVGAGDCLADHPLTSKSCPRPRPCSHG